MWHMVLCNLIFFLKKNVVWAFDSNQCLFVHLCVVLCRFAQHVHSIIHHQLISVVYSYFAQTMISFLCIDVVDATGLLTQRPADISLGISSGQW